ncbi:MAG: Ldh family oxidoreductase [Candidatus Heimdallarchaeota archaeon]|nr:Ldh family oxidoreductase [Candidatus Heimdallarchaeota archaeon]
MSDTRDHFKVSDIQKFSVEVLIKSGYPEVSAKATVHALLEADKRGIFSHGLAGGTGLEESVKGIGLFSTVDPKAEPEILPQKYPALAIIDAHGAPGHITSMKAVHLLEKLARKNGIAKVYVCEGNHFGAAGVWSEMIAAQGDLIGTVTCTTSALVKPMGDDPKGLDYTKGAGTEVRIGTNPIAVSVPHKEGIMTVDMALTRMAANYCIKAYKTGDMLTIPEYAADKDYKSTLDPKEFIVREDSGEQHLTGSIFPLGSTQAGYKGDALLRMIEVEHSVYGGPIEKLTVGEKKQRVSLAFQAQVIDCHYTEEEARNRVRELMIDYESKYFGKATRWPGDRSQEAYSYSLEEGIPYSDGQIEMLKRAAKHVGLDFDRMITSIGNKLFPHEIFKK